MRAVKSVDPGLATRASTASVYRDPRFGPDGRTTSSARFGNYREADAEICGYPAAPRPRNPMADLRVVEIEDKELTGLRVDDDTAVDSFSMHADDDREDASIDDADELRADVDDDKPATAAPIIPRLTPAEPMIAERTSRFEVARCRSREFWVRRRHLQKRAGRRK